MKVQVKFFAAARQLAGSPAVELELPALVTVADVRAAVAARFPALAEIDRHLVFAVNAAYASEQTLIPEQAEVACIPPVSGG